MNVVKEERRWDDKIIEDLYLYESSLRWWSNWVRESRTKLLKIGWVSMITMGSYNRDREDYESWRERMILMFYRV